MLIKSCKVTGLFSVIALIALVLYNADNAYCETIGFYLLLFTMCAGVIITWDMAVAMGRESFTHRLIAFSLWSAFMVIGWCQYRDASIEYWYEGRIIERLYNADNFSWSEQRYIRNNVKEGLRKSYGSVRDTTTLRDYVQCAQVPDSLKITSAQGIVKELAFRQYLCAKKH